MKACIVSSIKSNLENGKYSDACSDFYSEGYDNEVDFLCYILREKRLDCFLEPLLLFYKRDLPRILKVADKKNGEHFVCVAYRERKLHRVLEAIKLEVESFYRENNERKALLHLIADKEKEQDEIFNLLKNLKKHGVDLHHRYSNGETILHYAIKYNNVCMVVGIIKSNLETLRIEDNNGLSPLSYASNRLLDKILDRFQELDTHGRKIIATDFLSILAKRKDQGVQIVKRLIGLGKSASIGEVRSDPAREIMEKVDIIKLFFEFVSFGKTDIVKFFLDRYPDIVNSKFEGKTALFFAIERGDVKLVELLLKKKANLSIEYEGRSPIHYAAGSGSVEILRVLLKEKGGSSIAYNRDVSGYIPLYHAVMSVDIEVAKKMVDLLVKGRQECDINLVDREGYNTLDRLVLQGSEAGIELEGYLKSLGAVHSEKFKQSQSRSSRSISSLNSSTISIRRSTREKSSSSFSSMSSGIGSEGSYVASISEIVDVDTLPKKRCEEILKCIEKRIIEGFSQDDDILSEFGEWKQVLRLHSKNEDYAVFKWAIDGDFNYPDDNFIRMSFILDKASQVLSEKERLAMLTEGLIYCCAWHNKRGEGDTVWDASPCIRWIFKRYNDDKKVSIIIDALTELYRYDGTGAKNEGKHDFTLSKEVLLSEVAKSIENGDEDGVEVRLATVLNCIINMRKTEKVSTFLQDVSKLNVKTDKIFMSALVHSISSNKFAIVKKEYLEGFCNKSEDKIREVLEYGLKHAISFNKKMCMKKLFDVLSEYENMKFKIFQSVFKHAIAFEKSDLLNDILRQLSQEEELLKLFKCAFNLAVHSEIDSVLHDLFKEVKKRNFEKEGLLELLRYVLNHAVSSEIDSSLRVVLEEVEKISLEEKELFRLYENSAGFAQSVGSPGIKKVFIEKMRNLGSKCASLNEFSAYTEEGKKEKKDLASDNLQIIQKAFKIAKKKLGPGHPFVLDILYNMAEMLSKLGNKSKALEIYQEVLNAQKGSDVLGPDHPDTLSTQDSMAVLQQQMARLQQQNDEPGHYLSGITISNQSVETRVPD
ncbi:ankyrin repeat domain-containing protein [Wolbachia endosymbiont (group B) of Yponomeuta malinellus]|uniref:ankyrin repeat domain-containing protein n=1 Tax=Wolbachia endosymbiont (group B) of Yponomeuta malinellus TaxID=3066186 RepID=UPI003132B635